MSDARQAYQQLIGILHDTATLDSIGGLLSWDEQTQMPSQGAELRANQSALIARLSHRRLTSPQTGELLATVEGSDLVSDSDTDEAVNVREVRRTYDRAVKLPSSLVEELSRTAVLAQQAWIDARKRSDYPTFQPWLGKMLNLKREEAACVGYTGHVYDALLDLYEPGETTEGVRRVFDELRAPLVDLVGRITQSSRKAPIHLLQRHFPAAQQAKLAREAAELVGFDFSAGRLDSSVHPFCSGIGPGDCRMTTRYDEAYFGDAFFGVLHETGHGLYDQGLPPIHWGTPRGEAVSLGIHESQSRMWENLVARSRPFWRFFFPKVREAFPAVTGDIAEEQWVFAVNDVQPSFIRTEADEVTYNLHILIRFELEQAMLAGELAVPDIPAAWNEKTKQYLGLNVPDNARGCLQDIHWSIGSIGYFPTYTLGNLYAAQFYEQAHRDISGLDEELAQGQFTPLLGWLRGRIHSQGKRFRARTLVKRVTGQNLSAGPLLRHLGRKAAEWYGV